MHYVEVCDEKLSKASQFKNKDKFVDEYILLHRYPFYLVLLLT